jgi:hypothetical protein
MRPGRQADAEQAYRDAAAAGDPNALRALAEWLDRRPGRQADAEQAYRDATAAGNPTAVRALALWLGEQGRQAEADRIHRGHRRIRPHSRGGSSPTKSTGKPSLEWWWKAAEPRYSHDAVTGHIGATSDLRQ